MILVRTPFRISLFGGGSDYPEWYRDNESIVVGMAIKKYSYIIARKLPGFFSYKSRLMYSKIETVNDNNDIEHNLIRESLKYMGIDYGVEVCHYSDLPSRSGIGSSSTFTVGMINAISSLNFRGYSNLELANAAIDIERNILKETGGHQDQIWAAYGGFNKLVFNHRGFSVNPILIPESFEKDLCSHMILVFTGQDRVSGHIAASYCRNIDSLKKKLIQNQELAHRALEAIRAQDITQIGLLLHEAWNLKKSQSDSISNPTIDSIYEVARSYGAIGGKLLGAGGGGFLLLVFDSKDDKLKAGKELGYLTQVDIEIDYDGSKLLYFER